MQPLSREVKQPERPRHKKKSSRGTFPVFHRIPKKDQGKWGNMFKDLFEWRVSGRYKTPERAEQAAQALNQSCKTFEYKV